MSDVAEKKTIDTALMDQLATRLNAVLNGDVMPPPFGFILLTFDANTEHLGHVHSVSSIVPEDTVRILEQHAKFLKGRLPVAQVSG